MSSASPTNTFGAPTEKMSMGEVRQILQEGGYIDGSGPDRDNMAVGGASATLTVLDLAPVDRSCMRPRPAAWPAAPDPRAPDPLLAPTADMVSLAHMLQNLRVSARSQRLLVAPCLRILERSDTQPGPAERTVARVQWDRLPFAEATVPVYPEAASARLQAVAEAHAKKMQVVQWHVPARLPMSAVPCILNPTQLFTGVTMVGMQFDLLYMDRMLAGSMLKRPKALTQRINRAYATQVRLLEAWFRTALSDLLARPDPTMAPSVLGADEPRIVLFRVAQAGERASVFRLPSEELGRVVAPFARLFLVYTQRQRHLLELVTLMMTGLLQENRAALLRGNPKVAARADIGELVGWPDVQCGLDESSDAYWASVPARYRALLSPLLAPDPAPLSELRPYEVVDPGERLCLAQEVFLREHADFTQASVRDPALAAVAEDPNWADSILGGSPTSGRVVLAATIQLCVLALLDEGTEPAGTLQDTPAARAAAALATQVRAVAPNAPDADGDAMEV